MIQDIINNNWDVAETQALIVLVLWVIPLFAYFVDFWTGVEGAKAQDEDIHSKGLRKTIVKIGEYWRFQLMALLIDLVGSLIPAYTLPYVSMIATVSIILIEFKSVRENFKKKKSGVSKAITLSESLIAEIVEAKDTTQATKILAKAVTKNKEL
ncbi:MAG: phage holin family protein [Rikenellaceae bacterium]